MSAAVQCPLYHSQSIPGPGPLLTVRGMVNDLTNRITKQILYSLQFVRFFSFSDKFASDLVHYFNLLALQLVAVFSPSK